MSAYGSQVCDTTIEMAAELREYYIVLHAAHIRLFSSYPALQSVLFWLTQKAKKWADITRVTLLYEYLRGHAKTQLSLIFHVYFIQKSKFRT